MSDVNKPTSMIRLLGIFLLTLAAGQAALVAIGYFLPNLPIPSTVGVVTVMIAAMYAGQSQVRQTGRRATSGEKWIFVVLATVLSMAVSFGFLWGLLRYAGLPFSFESIALLATGNPAMATELAEILPMASGLAAALVLFMCWLGFTLGARTQIKQNERLAAKGQ